MKKPPMPPELENAVIDGVMGLVALRLRGSPGTDTAPATARLWIVALNALPIVWDVNLDRLRLHRAFELVIVNIEQWPAPAQFIKMIPPREPQRLLNAPTSNSMSPATRKMIDAMLNKMRHNVSAEQ